MKKPTVAICYDFDMTLSPKNMQEFKFFDDLGFTPNEFWTKQNYFCEKKGEYVLLLYQTQLIPYPGSPDEIW